MESHSKLVTKYGYIQQLFLKRVTKSCIIHGFGLYIVVENLSDVNYRIKSETDPEKFHIVHFDRLKPCVPNTRFQPPPGLEPISTRPPPPTILVMVLFFLKMMKKLNLLVITPLVIHAGIDVNRLDYTLM